MQGLIQHLKVTFAITLDNKGNVDQLNDASETYNNEDLKSEFAKLNFLDQFSAEDNKELDFSPIRSNYENEKRKQKSFSKKPIEFIKEGCTSFMSQGSLISLAESASTVDWNVF